VRSEERVCVGMEKVWGWKPLERDEERKEKESEVLRRVGKEREIK